MRRNKVFFNLVGLVAMLFSHILSVSCLYAQEDAQDGRNSKPTIAFRAIEHEKVMNQSFSETILIEELELALVASRKFDVLSRDRNKLGIIREEQELSKSDLSSGNSAETGKLETADYLVLPVITGFSFGRTANAIPNIDSKYYISDSGSLNVRFQLLDSTTGAIKSAIPTDVKFSTAQSISNSAKGSPSSASFRSLCKDTAKQFVTGLVDTIYPTKIIKITNSGEIWLNRGKDSGIAIGNVFKVYLPGEEIKDPDTGESLGSAEVYKGEIKITRTNPKASVAKNNSSKLELPFAEGDIVRGN